MEFITLVDFLKSRSYLQKGDYVYEHDKEGYPLQKHIDASKLYFVIKNDGHKVKLYSFTNDVIEIDIEKEQGNWWVLSLPPLVRKQLGMQ